MFSEGILSTARNNLLLFTGHKIINTQCLHSNYQGLVSLLLFIYLVCIFYGLYLFKFLRVMEREWVMVKRSDIIWHLCH